MLKNRVRSCALLAVAFLASALGQYAVTDPNPRLGNVEFIGQLCFNAGTSRVMIMLSRHIPWLVCSRRRRSLAACHLTPVPCALALL